MDPIPAFALAGNVLQVVELSLKVAKGCKEIYQQGSIAEHDDIFAVAEALSSTGSVLTDQIAQSTVLANQPRLKKVAQESKATADELITILNELKSATRQSRGRALMYTIKTLAQRRPIEKLLRRLKEQDELLNSPLVKELCQQSEPQALLQSSSSAELEKIKADFVQQSSNLQASLDGNHAAMFRHGLHSEARIISQINTHSNDAQNDRAYKDLMKSFFFLEMASRQTVIQERITDYGNTFSWLFRSSLPDQSDPGFLTWLQTQRHQEHGCFWVTGKPGSGKSSLMNFIYESFRIDKLGDAVLTDWAPVERRLVLCHFFSQPAFTDLQKSFVGYLRAMCYQVLSSDPKLQRAIWQDSSAPHPIRLRMSRVSTPTTWLLRELKECFEYLLDKVTCNKIVFMIVDGLDELVGDQEHAANYLQALDKMFPKLKICCSSRPEIHFQEIFGTNRCLTLQQFTTNDIEEYCHTQLSGTKAASLQGQIVVKAEGVFLWLYLVIKDLRQAARYADEGELLRLLQDCPSDMSDLFSHMLQKADLHFEKKSTLYLAMAHIHSTTPDSIIRGLRTSAFIIADKFDHLLDQGIFSRPKVDLSLARKMLEACAGGYGRITALSCGLLESEEAATRRWRMHHQVLLDKITDNDEQLVGGQIAACLAQWKFIHKSVHEFFNGARHKNNAPELFSTSNLELRTKIFRANLAILRIITALTPTSISLMMIRPDLRRRVYYTQRLMVHLEWDIENLLDLGFDMSDMTTKFEMLVESILACLQTQTNNTGTLHDLAPSSPTILDDEDAKATILGVWVLNGPSLELQLRVTAARVPMMRDYIVNTLRNAPANHRSQLSLIAFIQLLSRHGSRKELDEKASREFTNTAMQYLVQGDSSIAEPISLVSGAQNSSWLYCRVETTVQDAIVAHALKQRCWAESGVRLSGQHFARIIQYLIDEGAMDSITFRVCLTHIGQITDTGEKYQFVDSMMTDGDPYQLESGPPGISWMQIECNIPSLVRLGEELGSDVAVPSIGDVLKLRVVGVSPSGTNQCFVPSTAEQTDLTGLLLELFQTRARPQSVDHDYKTSWRSVDSRIGDYTKAMIRARKDDFSSPEVRELKDSLGRKFSEIWRK